MSLPGFTAEASLYRKGRGYREPAARPRPEGTASPAQAEAPLGGGENSPCFESCLQQFGHEPERLQECLLGCGL